MTGWSVLDTSSEMVVAKAEGLESGAERFEERERRCLEVAVRTESEDGVEVKEEEMGLEGDFCMGMEGTKARDCIFLSDRLT